MSGRDAIGVPLDRVLARSVDVIRENQDASGAYVASPSLPAYRHSWFRDGAFIADAMSRTGERESAEAFFTWCAGIIGARAGHLEDLVERHRAGAAIGRAEHLHCRYTVDGREVTSEWSNHQLDGVGIWLWALDLHAARYGADVVERDRDVLALVARYAAEFWREPCFDWWEERWGRHTATLASVYAGLRAASGWSALPSEVREEAGRAAAGIRETVAAEGAPEGRLVARLGEGGLDASLVACATPFRLLDPRDPVMLATVAALEAEIAHGGVHRFPGDTYYGGGEWLLLAALLGWWYAEVGRRDDAEAELRWVGERATTAGDLPEQVDEHVFDPGALEEWVRRWGPSPVPLLWSHAMLLTLASELGVLGERAAA